MESHRCGGISEKDSVESDNRDKSNVNEIADQ